MGSMKGFVGGESGGELLEGEILGESYWVSCFKPSRFTSIL